MLLKQFLLVYQIRLVLVSENFKRRFQQGLENLVNFEFDIFISLLESANQELSSLDPQIFHLNRATDYNSFNDLGCALSDLPRGIIVIISLVIVEV